MLPPMFIRRTLTRRTDGQAYYSHRLVHSEREGAKVRQRTLLNLGSGFDIDQRHWPTLCRRIDEIRHGQASLLPAVPAPVETEAQRISAQLLARSQSDETGAAPEWMAVELDSLALTRPRSVGVEQVGLWALAQVGLDELLAAQGVNAALRAAAIGSIVGRLACPASERATHAWLCERSALGELLDVHFARTGAMQLYRASDALLKHRAAIETHLFTQAMDLFDLAPTVTLYDLTNTYYEGEADAQPLAQRGHSKEKRSDCKLLTLGLVLDASGFVRRSRVFAGNVREDQTLAAMLEALNTPPGALVVLDRGIATEAQVTWLKDNDYRYIVVSRAQQRRFDADTAVAHRTRGGETVQLAQAGEPEAGEVRLYCYSAARAEKERAIAERFMARFEQGLTALHDGLSRPRTRKQPAHVWQRIGRLKANSHGIGQHYTIEVDTDETGQRAVAVRWQRRPVTGSLLTHPGVYCLRSNLTDWDEARLWQTYTLLTDIEAVFRALKSELGLRPIYHRTPRRAEGHLFITVIAYQLAQVIRRRLAAHGDESCRNASWTTLRRILGSRQRVTASVQRQDGRTVHIRKATRPEPKQQAILDALGIRESPGGTQKEIV